MQQQVWRELFTRAASAAVAARVNNSRHIVSGIWLRYFFKDHKRRARLTGSLRRPRRRLLHLFLKDHYSAPLLFNALSYELAAKSDHRQARARRRARADVEESVHFLVVIAGAERTDLKEGVRRAEGRAVV